MSKSVLQTIRAGMDSFSKGQKRIAEQGALAHVGKSDDAQLHNFFYLLCSVGTYFLPIL